VNELLLHLTHDAPTEEGDIIPKGFIVAYLGHVPGGMIKVLFLGGVRVIHPATTKELS
jgi:hypothetical protein